MNRADNSFIPPRAIIFDWDSTLVDNWGAIAAGMNYVLGAFGQPLWSLEEVKQRCNISARARFPELFGDDWHKAYELFYQRIVAVHLDHLDALPGAAEMLRCLAVDCRLPLFVVSNKRGDNLRRQAEHLGWTPYFTKIVGATDAARDKPERDPVDLVLEGSGISADNPAVWFVGDSDLDVMCAKNAGLTPVLMHNTEAAVGLGVARVFSDCQALRSLLYNQLVEQRSGVAG